MTKLSWNITNTLVIETIYQVINNAYRVCDVSWLHNPVHIVLIYQKVNYRFFFRSIEVLQNQTQ